MFYPYSYEITNVEVLKGNAEYAIQPSNNTSTFDANSLLHGVTDVNGVPLLANERRRAARTHTIFVGSAAIPAAHTNGYLCDAPDAFIENRSKPICDVPPMNSLARCLALSFDTPNAPHP